MATPLGLLSLPMSKSRRKVTSPTWEKWLNHLSLSLTGQIMKNFSLPALKALGCGSTARSPRGPALKSVLRPLQMRLTRRVSWLSTSHIIPASTSPTRHARLALLIFSPFMPVLFLNSRLSGVPSNPYGITETLNVDRDDARVNYRRKKLEQPFV